VSLAQAREKAADARKQRRNGTDLIETRRVEKAARWTSTAWVIAASIKCP
jgi:hypothetical protein